ncbi:MAG TPA: NADH:flavin oxidoreductase/NADH oxidase [Candidatus Acidoferrales bacterium]|jgi:2,4-dienoyl-CoA reductase-like NADH-dependent reductase (Old Yellow Enzyme family)|nr:NADH:flavin oxidoreductase/NADH oxidase [Candidatus Acidoferrales bacterium]
MGPFDELKIREVTLRNRIVVSPMCQYSSTDGFASDWHLVHLGSRAVGGAALVFTEATAVAPEGRISPQDLGIWKDEHIEMLARITRFIRSQGALTGVQLAHAGRKASTYRPWEKPGTIPESAGGWKSVAPSAVPFEGYATPAALDENGIQEVVKAFAAAARRACQAGFQVVELHAAHGYLIHQFLSPLANKRTDSYGGSFENRTRLVREVIAAVRKVWPEGYPLWVRISATDWIEGGWDLEQSVELAKQIGPLGVDLVDCSSGGISPKAKIPVRAGYQVPFAEEIRRKAGIMTGAVGMITTPAEVDEIIRDEKADVVLMAREFLRQPYWPLGAAQELGFANPWPVQYLRAAPDGSPAREPVNLPELKRCMSEHHAIPES